MSHGIGGSCALKQLCVCMEGAGTQLCGVARWYQSLSLLVAGASMLVVVQSVVADTWLGHACHEHVLY